MAKINKELLKKFVEDGFFKEAKSVEDVVIKLDQRGFSITGKKKGLLAQLLTFLCQEAILEREKDKDGKWRYKKI